MATSLINDTLEEENPAPSPNYTTIRYAADNPGLEILIMTDDLTNAWQIKVVDPMRRKALPITLATWRMPDHYVQQLTVVYFRNRTERPIDLFYEGIFEPKHFARIPPFDEEPAAISADMDWMPYYFDAKMRLQVDENAEPDIPLPIFPQKKVVNITLGMQRLDRLALIKIAEYTKTIEAVDKWDLPDHSDLKDRLRKLVEDEIERSKYRKSLVDNNETYMMRFDTLLATQFADNEAFGFGDNEEGDRADNNDDGRGGCAMAGGDDLFAGCKCTERANKK